MIYKMNKAELKKATSDFYDTEYGKTVFVTAYLIPLITGVMGSVAFVGECAGYVINVFLTDISLVTCIVSLMIGNAYYYKEVRKFIESKTVNKITKKTSRRTRI